MKLNIDTQTDDAQIQIIPLIDVIFCILTFFILAALQLTRQQGINLDLPKASTGQVQMREMLVVTIDSAGQTYVDKQLVDRGQLYQAIKDYHTQKPDGLLVLNAAQTAFYNDVVQVLDMLRSVGGDRVALATVPQPNSTPGTNLSPGSNNPSGSGVNPAPTINPIPTGLNPSPSSLTPNGLPGTGFSNPSGGLTPSPGTGANQLQPNPTNPGQTTPNSLIVPPGSGTFPTPVPSSRTPQ